MSLFRMVNAEDSEEVEFPTRLGRAEPAELVQLAPSPGEVMKRCRCQVSSSIQSLFQFAEAGTSGAQPFDALGMVSTRRVLEAIQCRSGAP